MRFSYIEQTQFSVIGGLYKSEYFIDWSPRGFVSSEIMIILIEANRSQTSSTLNSSMTTRIQEHLQTEDI